MFERYENAKKRPGSKFLRVTIALSLAAHVAAGVIFLIVSLWKIDKIDPKATDLVFAAASMAVPPPPPPPPPPARKSSVKRTETPKPVKPTELVQPDKDVKPKAEKAEKEEEPDNGGQEGGVEGGEKGGEIGGELGGEIGGTPGSTGPPTPPPPAAMQNVAQADLDALAIGGTNMPDPPGGVTKMIVGQGLKSAKVKVKLCLSAGGGEPKLDMIKSSGYPELDQHVIAAMKKWKFKPFMVNGQGAPSCAPYIIRFDFE